MSISYGSYVKLEGSDEQWVVTGIMGAYYELKTDLYYEGTHEYAQPPFTRKEDVNRVRYWTKRKFPDGTWLFKSQDHTTAHMSKVTPWIKQ